MCWLNSWLNKIINCRFLNLNFFGTLEHFEMKVKKGKSYINPSDRSIQTLHSLNHIFRYILLIKPARVKKNIRNLEIYSFEVALVNCPTFFRRRRCKLNGDTQQIDPIFKIYIYIRNLQSVLFDAGFLFTSITRSQTARFKKLFVFQKPLPLINEDYYNYLFSYLQQNSK